MGNRYSRAESKQAKRRALNALQFAIALSEKWPLADLNNGTALRDPVAPEVSN